MTSNIGPGRMSGLGAQVFHLAEVDSTMAEASRRARGGEASPFWVVADRQTAGRGRQGRNWHSPEGNLHATLHLAEPCPAERGAELGFVAGLALHDAVVKTTGLSHPSVALKWPNDLLHDKAKVAGLLLEGQTAGKRFSVAIGIGVNIHAAPADTPYPARALADSAPSLTSDRLFAALAEAMERRLAQWRGDGFAGIRADWRARAAFLGERVTLRLPEGVVEGRFEDIDAAGRLQLLTSDGARVIDAGDLFFSATQA